MYDGFCQADKKVAVIMRWPYYRSGRKAGFHCMSAFVYTLLQVGGRGREGKGFRKPANMNQLLYMAYCIRSNKRCDAYSIFHTSNMALIPGWCLFEGELDVGIIITRIKLTKLMTIDFYYTGAAALIQGPCLLIFCLKCRAYSSKYVMQKMSPKTSSS